MHAWHRGGWCAPVASALVMIQLASTTLILFIGNCWLILSPVCVATLSTSTSFWRSHRGKFVTYHKHVPVTLTWSLIFKGLPGIQHWHCIPRSTTETTLLLQHITICYTMWHNMGGVLMLGLKHYSPRHCPSSGSRRVSDSSMELPFKDNQNNYLIWCSQTLHACLKACTYEIASTTYLPWQVDHLWADSAKLFSCVSRVMLLASYSSLILHEIIFVCKYV